jgi:hypothetical protein
MSHRSSFTKAKQVLHAHLRFLGPVFIIVLKLVRELSQVWRRRWTGRA